MCRFLALLALLIVVVSCGAPRTSIRVTNSADGTDTKISVTQGDGGATSVTVNPSVSAAIDSVTFNIH